MDLSDLNRLLALLPGWDASDLHISAGSPPSVRIDGDLRLLKDEMAFTPGDTHAIALAIMPREAAATFEEAREADFAYSVPGIARFRVNAYSQRGSISMAFRLVRTSPASAAELGMPETIYRLSEERLGLVLVTGPTGSGKTTTLATMIDHINEIRPCHIVTIEDPIEFLQQNKQARIDQREVGIDTMSFASAMRVVLRQDPDVILIGEMRDTETTSAAISAAETGHLVLSTLHTINATETISRIVDFFPPHQQHQIRVSLAGTLRGTVAQRLVHRSDGHGRVPAVEIMVVNGRIRECILDLDRTGDIPEIVQDGAYYGMQSFDQSLGALFITGTITLMEALANASNPHTLKINLEKRGLTVPGQTVSGNGHGRS